MATPPEIIRVNPLAGRDTWRDVLRIVPAWVASAGLHALLFLLFWLVIGPPTIQARDPGGTAAETVNTTVEPTEKPELLLTNLNEGIDATVPAGFDNNRIAEVDAPGPPNPSEAVGVLGTSEIPTASILAPPGSGGGVGGAPALADLSGDGIAERARGGMRGVRHFPGGYLHRSGGTRERTALINGGSRPSEAAVARGLKWLALHQAPQGHWALDEFHLHHRTDLNSTKFLTNTGLTGKGMKNDTAGAAFGVLPFLAAGITHKPSGRPTDDQYVKTVKRALEWLIANQAKDGRFGGSSMYEHGLATIAICEAYGLTADPALKYPAQKALDFIVKAQDPQGGGWRYQPRQAGDTSVVGWQVMALKSGQMGGLSVPNITLQLAAKYLDSCESTDGGGYGYTGPGDAPTMSAVGLLCRQYLGTPRRNANLQNGVKKLMKGSPPSGHQIYYEYYATQVFHHMGGDYWDFWNAPAGKAEAGMRDKLVQSQAADGSWDPRGDGHAAPGGRIMKTALSLLTLEVYYRHLPLYQRVDTKK